MTRLPVILFFCLALSGTGNSQTSDSYWLRYVVVSGKDYTGDSGKIIWSDTIPEHADAEGLLVRGICKGYSFIYLLTSASDSASIVIKSGRESVNPLPVIKKHVALLKISGNILYDVNYRSRIDTPYAENDIYQHTLQTRLDLVYRERYPFRLYLTTRFSNSSLFRRYTDINFLFNSADFKQMLKAKALLAAESFIASRSGMLDSLKRQIDLRRMAVATFSRSLQRPDYSQKLVEERERILFNQTKTHQLPDPMSMSPLKEPINWKENFRFKGGVSDWLQPVTDTSGDKLSYSEEFEDSLENRKARLDTLLKEMEAIEKLYKKLKLEQEYNSNELKKYIEGAKDINVLVQKLKELNIPDTILPNGYKALSSIRTLGIGRSTADYSELSVKNLSITGLQAEFNTGYYYAVAVGRVDYRFRDYIIPVRPRSRQYIALARFGRGNKDGNHVIFTYYTGRRQFFNASVASQPDNRIPEYNLAGITVEGFYKISRNISLIGEVAKSTAPYYSLDSLNRKGWMNSVTRFNDRTNEAYAARLHVYFPRSQTRIAGNLRYTGANFQSFSTFTTGASQLRWKGRLEQPFLKKQITIVSSLEQNDYNNPFIITAYKSSSVLASLQANLRIKKWPVISLGYYPSFQVVKIADDQYSESRYHTLSASAGYYYRANSVQLSSCLVYSQFYNEASDSGFVYYNSKNLLLSQNVIFNKITLVINAALNASTDYAIYTFENSGQFTISKVISAGAGIKMIKHDLLPAMQWGYSGSISLIIPRLGEIQLMIDKGFIPGMDRQLAENKTGRLTYYKTF